MHVCMQLIIYNKMHVPAGDSLQGNSVCARQDGFEDGHQ